MIEKLLLMSFGICCIFLILGFLPVVSSKEPYAWGFVLPCIIMIAAHAAAHWGLLCWTRGFCSI